MARRTAFEVVGAHVFLNEAESRGFIPDDAMLSPGTDNVFYCCVRESSVPRIEIMKRYTVRPGIKAGTIVIMEEELKSRKVK